MSFLQRIERYSNTIPERTILSDEEGEITYRQIWSMSGCVYARLLEMGVGKEDVVLIHLPRSAKAVMTMIGVFRAGAAVILLEDWGPNKWVYSVIQDVRPRLIIDSDWIDSVQMLNPIDGYQEHNMHDLAYITYTTGTTGESKGVMHEYGTFYRLLYSCDSRQDQNDYQSDRTAVITTMHSSVTTYVINLAINSYTDIVPQEVFTDPKRFHTRLVEKHITYTYLSPVYLHRFGMLSAPDLRYISVSFEPIQSIYSNEIEIYNDYGMSETGSSVCCFLIDRLYDITPIGKPLPGFQLAIMDEHNQQVPDGELGEICVDNIYCRGYLNLPEQTSQQFINGWYHTRDLGMRLKDGNYVMYGRISDALRTSDGLIIALEIEVAVRKVLGRNSAYVKVFSGNPKPIICLYTDFVINFPAVQAALKNELPIYKLPTDYVQVLRFEYNNGKVIRVNLQNPRL